MIKWINKSANVYRSSLIVLDEVLDILRVGGGGGGGGGESVAWFFFWEEWNYLAGGASIRFPMTSDSDRSDLSIISWVRLLDSC